MGHLLIFKQYGDKAIQRPKPAIMLKTKTRRKHVPDLKHLTGTEMSGWMTEGVSRKILRFNSLRGRKEIF